MGKFTRSGGAALLAGALVLTPLAAQAEDDSVNIDVDGAPEYVETEFNPNIYRFASYDRVTTAIEAAERTDGLWGRTSGVPSEYSGKYAIIANTKTFSDALAAAPLADELDAPILLSDPGEAIDGRVMAYLARENFDGVILTGGSDVFGEGVVAQVNAAGMSADRAEGANRYQTAISLAAMAQYVDSYNDGNMQRSNVFLASGLDFPDALAAGSAAAAHSGVVLLTKGDGGLDSKTFEAITDWTNMDFDMDFGLWSPQNHADIIGVGGPAVDAAEVGWLADPIELNASVVGKNRYHTAVQLAERYVGHEDGNHVIASGEKFPDGVVAGGYAANVDGPLLLTKEGHLPNVVANYFMKDGVREQVENIFVFGGHASVSPAVSAAIAALPWDY